MSLFKSVFIILLISTLFTGCVTTTNGPDPAAQRAQEYKQILDPMLGVATKSDIKNRYGEPLKKEMIENTELWYYKKNLGAYRTGYSEPGDDRTSRSGNIGIWEVFDELKFRFDGNNILRQWEVNVQR